MKKLFGLLFAFHFSLFTFAQQSRYNCYPTHWFTGMKWNKVQVMVHGEKVAENFPIVKMGPKE
jgi:hypothetical protein